MRSLLSHFKTPAMLLTLIGAANARAEIAGPIQPWPSENSPAVQEAAIATANPEATSAASQARAPATTAAEQNQEQEQTSPEAMQIIQQMLGMFGGGGGMGGMGGPESGDMSWQTGDTNMFGGQNFSPMSQVVGSGVVEKCGNVPATVRMALGEAERFRGKCSLAQRGNNQKYAINDYSGAETPPMMYIFDLEGNCLGKTAITYGNGAGRTQPQPCNDEGKHLTPAGFHLTSTHFGSGKYGPNNSLGMVGLEGQGSVARGILIHGANAPGTASSWGCTGVGKGALGAVMTTLGEGSLVYNYFGDTTGPCRNTSGLTGQHNGMCRLDPGGSVPATSTGGGAPATR